MPLVNLLSHTFREYEFVTGLYLLEPWEKRAVNVTLLSITAATLFSFSKFVYTFEPLYSGKAQHFLNLKYSEEQQVGKFKAIVRGVLTPSLRFGLQITENSTRRSLCLW